MISAEQVHAIASKIESAGINEATVSELRQEYHPVHFTYCMDDDLPNNKPVFEHTDFNLYLIDGREHCLCLTNNFDHATGIVIAEIILD